jgi:hypothetical protein
MFAFSVDVKRKSGVTEGGFGVLYRLAAWVLAGFWGDANHNG